MLLVMVLLKSKDHVPKILEYLEIFCMKKILRQHVLHLHGLSVGTPASFHSPETWPVKVSLISDSKFPIGVNSE